MGYEYRVIEARTAAGLTVAVNDALREGWELWGNMAAEISRLYQAVVRYNPQAERDIPGHLETALSEPAGFSVSVPETPAPDEQAESMPLEVTPAAGRENSPAVLAAVPLLHLVPIDLEGLLCCCFEVLADNPDCPVHKDQQPAGVRI